MRRRKLLIAPGFGMPTRLARPRTEKESLGLRPPSLIGISLADVA